MPRSREDAYEPAYVDDRDLESGRRARYPPGPPPAYEDRGDRPRDRPRRRHDDDYPPAPPKERRPRRQYSDSDDDSPPRREQRRRSPKPMPRARPRRHDSESPPPPPRREREHAREPRDRPRRREADPREYDDLYDDYHRDRRRADGGRSKYEGYYSDNRDNRARPGRYADERYMTDRSREDRYRDRDGHPRDRRRPGAPVRKESKWQKEATDAFKTYALPVIKAEGGKFVTKQLGAFLANQGGKR